MSDVFALEEQRKNFKELVDRRNMAIKLSKNREFNKLILEEFCVNECARYAQSSADPALGPVERADALAIAQAAGHLRRFLSVVVQMGAHAEREIENIDEEIAEARAEEDAQDGVFLDDDSDEGADD